MKRERAIFVGIPAAAALLCLCCYGDFGITWDENVQRQYGDMVLNYFASGFQDTRCNSFLNLYFYGGIVELIAACCYETLGSDVFATRHLVTGLIAVTTVPAVMLYGRRLGRSLWLPVFCAFALLGLPRFVGHACNNSKDIPLAAMFAIAMFAIARLLSQERMSWKAVTLTAIPVGLALAVRVGGVLVLAYACAGVALRIAQRWPQKPDLKAAAGRVALFIGIAWLLMLAFWPWAQQNPVLHPQKAFREATAFSHAKQVLFAGEQLSSKELPP
ncbi:MAG: 4-amino-4-deoxy-L-arabinose transferase-like glycosyltransferase, partial [Rhodothermales bacterium]